MMALLADLFLRHRWWAGAAVVAISLVAAFGASRLRVDDVPSSIFRSHDEEYARLEEVFRDFGPDDADCLVLLEAGDVLTPAGVAAVRLLDRRLSEVEGVADVVSLADVPVLDGGLVPRPFLPLADDPPGAFERARERAGEHPLVGGQLLSPDGRIALTVARLGEAHMALSEMRPRVEELRRVVREVGRETGLRTALTGVPPIRIVIFDEIAREQRLYPVLAAIVSFAIGLALFRRLAPVVVTCAASMLAGLWAFGLMGLLGEPINVLNTELPLLMMVIAFTDAIHLMIHALRRREAGAQPLEAAADAIRKLGLPCAVTSLTTAVGFASLAVSDIEAIQDFGTVFAAAVAMSFVVVLCVVPLGASLVLGGTPPGAPAVRFAALHRPFERLFRRVLGRARTVTALGLGATAALLAVALQLVPDNRLTEATPRGDESVAVLRELEEAFGGVLAASVLVEWPPGLAFPSPEVVAVIDAVQAELRESDFTHAPLSVLDLARLAPGTAAGVLPDAALAPFLHREHRRALVHTRVPDEGSKVAEPAYRDLQRRLDGVRRAHPDFEVHLTGTGYVARRNVNVMIRDFARSLALAALVIFAVLTVAFRSLRLGAISVLPNVFPLVVAAALLVAFGQELQVTSVLAFTVCLGIAVDDTVHFVERFRAELTVDGDVREAAVRAFVGVGRALAITTLVLVGGFSVTFLSAIPTSNVFTAIVTIGLGAALLGDLFLLPALLVTFVRSPRAVSAAAMRA